MDSCPWSKLEDKVPFSLLSRQIRTERVSCTNSFELSSIVEALTQVFRA